MSDKTRKTADATEDAKRLLPFEMSVHVVDGIDTNDASGSDIQLVVVFRLPFRLKVGELFRRRFQHDGRAVEVAIHNRVSLPDENAVSDWLNSPDTDSSALRSEALTIFRHPRLDGPTLETLRDLSAQAGRTGVAVHRYNVLAVDVVNRFIAAYATATSQVHGGVPLRLLRFLDFSESPHWQYVLFGAHGGELSDETIRRLCQGKTSSSRLSPLDLYDLSVQSLSSIDQYLSAQDHLVHHDLAFEARGRIETEDYTVCLLLAVAALEAAHAALVHHAFSLRIPDAADSHNRATRFLSDLGISELLSLTPYLFLEEAERPTAEHIARAKEGITMRNAIVHGTRNSSGGYRLRSYATDQKRSAISAVLGIYELYSTAVDARRVRTDQ